MSLFSAEIKRFFHGPNQIYLILLHFCSYQPRSNQLYHGAIDAVHKGPAL